MVHVVDWRRAEVRRQFIEFDRDGDGVVSIEEAHNVLQSQLGFSVNQSVELVRRYDLNGDGRLNYEEFVCFYAKVKTKWAMLMGHVVNCNQLVGRMTCHWELGLGQSHNLC